MVRIVWGVILILWGIFIAIAEILGFLLVKSIPVNLPYPVPVLILIDVVQCSILFVCGSLLIYYGDKARKTPPVVVKVAAATDSPSIRSDW